MMERKFNVKGVCVPAKHYMVDIMDRLEKMKVLVAAGEYFVINRGRQYGKTTTLAALEDYLANEYTVISLSFQGLGDTIFESEESFCLEFLTLVADYLELSNLAAGWFDEKIQKFSDLSRHITKMCKEQKIVLMIDEVDKASNHRVFLNFLGMLRNKYQVRNRGKDFTFQSVVLAGVYDIKNIKLKMVQDGKLPLADGEKTVDSPWNIAENFAEDMSFTAHGLAGMLTEYEADYQTGMNIPQIAEEIYAYTSGYPFLALRICQYIHEKLEKNWTKATVKEAVRLIIEEPQPNTLFDDLFKNIRNHPELSDFLYELLMTGKNYKFAQGDEIIEQGLRYAFVRNEERNIVIHNKIFEIIITDYFISKERMETSKVVDNRLEIEVVNGEKFNIELFFEKFNSHYQKHYSQRDVDFIEREAAFLFLCFLQPYLNGKGTYYLESKPNFATGKRMDVVISYGGQEFIIELKIWRGESHQQDAYKQLTDYVTKRGAINGYLLTFDFRDKKQIKQEWIKAHGIPLLEVQV